MAVAEWKEKDIEDCPLGNDEDQVDAEENSLDDSQPWPWSFRCTLVAFFPAFFPEATFLGV
jgi:hypothetical protein